LTPSPQVGRKRKLDWKALAQHIQENPDALLRERAQHFRVHVSASDYLLQGLHLKEAKKFQKESSDKYSLSTLTEAFIKKSISKQRNNLFKFLIIPLAVTGITGFLVYRQISIQTAWKTVQETKAKEYNIRRHEALETLNFWKESLKNAPLEKADLTQIDFIDANLSGANLSGADLNGANLSDAYLSGATNLTISQIKSSCFWDRAIYNRYRHWDEKQNQLVADELVADEKANQQYIDQFKKDKSSDPETPPNCSRWK
jgi:hypothetical protein